MEDNRIKKVNDSKTLIISGFAGVGKSYCMQNPKDLIIKDSDSSQFDKDNFPKNYIDDIITNTLSGKYDIIFISAHREVRDALCDLGINHTYVMPDPSLKDEYLERYKQRGSPQEFIDLMDTNWTSFIASIGSFRKEGILTDIFVLEAGETMQTFLDYLADPDNAEMTSHAIECKEDNYQLGKEITEDILESNEIYPSLESDTCFYCGVKLTIFDGWHAFQFVKEQDQVMQVHKCNKCMGIKKIEE